MDNQTELKWYQKPTGVIALLILFFPIGIYQMWKNKLWTNTTRWIVTVIIILAVANANKEDSGKSKSAGLDTEFLGNYHGIQPSYFMKNRYGEYVVIYGNKVSIPSIENKFLLKENNVVSLQQINLEDNDRVYYDGTYKIISKEGGTIKIECALSDGKDSNPTYMLSINSSNKKGICSGMMNEPEFSIEKE